MHYNQVDDENEQQSPAVWSSGFQVKSWEYTIAVVGFAVTLIVLLIYCNVRYIGHVMLSSQVIVLGNEVVNTGEQDAYDINLMTDVKQLWTHCLEANGSKVCNASDEEKKWETELAVVLFVWSICFPFIKLFISLLFWFVPSSKWLREWVMYIKVHIGRWSLIEIFMLWTWIYCFKWDLEEESPIAGQNNHATLSTCFYLDDWGAVFVVCQLLSLGLSHVVMHLMDDSSNCSDENGGGAINEGAEDERESILSKCGLVNIIALVVATGNLVALYYIMFIDPVLKFKFTGYVSNVFHQLEHKISITMWELVTKSTDYACGHKILAILACYFTLLVCPILSSLSLFWWRVYLLIFPKKKKITQGWKTVTEIITVYNCLDVMILSLQFTNLYFPKIFRSLMLSATPDWITPGEVDAVLHGDFEYTTSYYLLFVYAFSHWGIYFFSEWQDYELKRDEAENEHAFYNFDAP